MTFSRPLRAQRSDFPTDTKGVEMGLRDYVVQTTDPSIATTKIAVEELRDAKFPTTWLKSCGNYRDRFGRTRPLETSLFPGYLFVAFDAAGHAWKALYELRGVKGVLGAGENPVALPLGAVDDLRARFDAGEFKPRAIPQIAIDDRVIVESGPLSLLPQEDRVGVCKLRVGERIDVMMKYFGAVRIVTLRADMVRMVPA